MKNKTLVKVKIVLEDNETGLVTYFWKSTFWFFGYWYPFGSKSSFSKLPKSEIDNINDNNVSDVLFNNFIRKK